MSNFFKSIGFSCIKCGSKNIQVSNVYSNLNETQSRDESLTDRNNDFETAFFISGILFCDKCNHRFYAKILDQGVKNTDLYFDNSLS